MNNGDGTGHIHKKEIQTLPLLPKKKFLKCLLMRYWYSNMIYFQKFENISITLTKDLYACIFSWTEG